MVGIRRKGVAIVETSKGILVVADKSKNFILPGGGANKGESRKNSAIRELKEETNLDTKTCQYLFNYRGKKWKSHSGRIVRNLGKVFLIITKGIARPRHEISYIDYYLPNKKINLSTSTKKIIEMYWRMKDNGEL